MRVKINDKWFDSSQTAICIELTGQDKDNIENMHPDCDKYAMFPDSESISKDEMLAWMDAE